MTYPTVTFDVESLAPEVGSVYGAPMGCSWGVIDPDFDECQYAATKIVLYGDYDKGGTYWGGGGQSLYCVHTIESDETRRFIRADNADDAFAQAGVPMHLRVTVEVPPLTFDCGECEEMDVTAILELFDTDQVYTSQVTGRGDTGRESFGAAKTESEEWVFTPQAYEAVRKWWTGMGGDSDADEPATERELRAIVLQQMAHLYAELESAYGDLDEDDDEFDSPLAMLRQAEWTDECECPVDLSIGDDGKIYYSLSG